MVWIKRNLLFVIGSFIALVCIGLGVWFLVVAISEESGVAEKANAQYTEAKQLSTAKPQPGGGSNPIDNIKNAKAQQASLKAFVAKVRPVFQRIPGIPDSNGATNKISNSEFAAELRNTIADLRKTATNLSVVLPPDYYFSFQSQRNVMIFDPAGLDKLAIQLGEVKALSSVLFDAKVNFLESVRREPVSTNDNEQADYLTQKTVSTPLADFSPYEITFRCFSAELADVMSRIGNSSNGLIIKTINVSPAEGAGAVDTAQTTTMPTPANPMPMPYLPGGGGGRYAPGYNTGGRLFPRPYTPMPVPVAPVATAPSTSPSAFIAESPLRVTMLVDVVKLKAASK